MVCFAFFWLVPCLMFVLVRVIMVFLLVLVCTVLLYWHVFSVVEIVGVGVSILIVSVL